MISVSVLWLSHCMYVSYITHKHHLEYFSMKIDVVQGKALHNLLYHPRYEKDGDGRTKLVPVYTFPLLQAVQQSGRQQSRQQSRQQHGLQQPLKVQPSFFPEFSLFHWLQVQPLLLQSQEPGLWEHEVSEAWSSGQSVYCGSLASVSFVSGLWLALFLGPPH